MTRNSELNCEDLSECDHTLEIPISENGEIYEWRCLCGFRRELDTGFPPNGMAGGDLK